MDKQSVNRSKTMISPQAVIEDGARIGEGVTIEPFAIVKSNVTLEDHVTIKSHAYIDGFTTIGHHTTVWPGAVIGTKTQDLKYEGEKTFIRIGSHCDIREYVTINSSCGENTSVVVGDNCLIMAYCHVAHNCIVGNHVIMANGSMLAGHVELGDYVTIGGMTPVHQKVRIGSHAMVGGLSRVTHDIPPFSIGAGVPYELGGLNLIGLKRRGIDQEHRNLLAKAFKLTYRSSLRLKDALAQIEDELPDNPYVKNWVDFCKTSQRGIIGLDTAKLKMRNGEKDNPLVKS